MEIELKMRTYRLLVVTLLMLVGCTSHYNDMVVWTDEELPLGISIDSVKSLQPDYLTVYWNRPDTFDLFLDSSSVTVLYSMELTRMHYDLLKMENLLIFKDGKYVGRECRK